MRYSLQQTVEPTEEPVTLEEVKDHCRVEIDDDDALFLSLITTARESLEIETGRQLLEATYVMRLDAFPGSCSHERLCIPRAPLQSVTSITYYDTDGTQQTLATTVYGTDIYSEPGLVYLKPGQTWPSTYEIPGAVSITYVAGWDNPLGIPSGLRSALKLIVAHLYENREESTEKLMHALPMGACRLMWHHKIAEAV